ncbi:MAG: hypothetical protein K2W95_23120 [Candidatus Obscuribacterales bacterium]|nr:hypothetical protein [Candidatus Obscuribacterales bacterium]
MKYVTAVMIALAACVATQTLAIAQPGRQFTREDYMVMNLNRGTASAGTQISEALRSARQSVKDLDRALRQMEQVDKAYAKSKGKPDDRYLTAATETLRKTLKTAQQLEVELEASRDELKSSIQEALIR